ncbi:Hypothetical_protein [Hexamita inflata]|uniref:Hypothetical_protein n=1 Tax=Hexamita inflata TaxID=28002 RepID=A0AA86VKF9_9EUKA|nr:Hypothetical protein HINF_LOCUS56868 [Hexamita inflata]
MSLESIISSMEQTNEKLTATLIIFKNSIATNRQQNQLQTEELIKQQDKSLVEYKEILRQTPVVPTLVRVKHKQISEQYQKLRAEFTSHIKQRQFDKPFDAVQKQSVNVLNQYTNQTAQLQEINRKVEESIQRVHMNNQEVLRQDEQLERVGQKLTGIQIKAGIAGELVNNMRKNEYKSTRKLIILFVILSVSNVIMISVLGTKKIGSVMNAVSKRNIAKSFIPKIIDMRDMNGQRDLKVIYWREWV